MFLVLLVNCPINSTRMDNSLSSSSSHTLDLSRIGGPAGLIDLHGQNIDLSMIGGATGNPAGHHGHTAGLHHGERTEASRDVQLEQSDRDCGDKNPPTILQSEDMELTGVSEPLRCHCGKECTR